MKESKKTMWPIFLFRCGFYSLENFKHVTKEMDEIQLMNFPTIAYRQHDLIDTAKNITTQTKIRKLTNELDKFDDFFQLASNYVEVEKEETT